MDSRNITSYLGLFSVGTLLFGYGAAIYAFVLFVKAAKRVIRVCDVYLADKGMTK